MKIRSLLMAALLGLGAWQWGEAGWIHAKAWLAQELIDDAWQQTLADGGVHRPWPWADTQPVARLQVPRLGVDQWILSDASGRSLAFGPGMVTGTARPGEPGHSLVSGHKDTHFRFVRELRAGDEIRVQDAQGRWLSYAVLTTEVRHQDDLAWWRETASPRLTLATCYPFEQVLPGTEWRWLVDAVVL